VNSYRKTAIIVGVLFIVATVAPLLSFPFSGFVDDPDDLIKVAENENLVIIGALLELIMAFAIIGTAIMIYPILKKHNEALALGYAGARIIEGILFIAGVIGLLSLVTLSQEFVKAGAPDASYFQSSGTLLLAVRDWGGHMLGSIVLGLGALMLYYLLFQSKLIPRWLSVWGLIGAPLALAEGLLSMFSVVDPFSTTAVLLNLPIAVNEMVLAVWLIVKGFNSSAIASLSVKTDTNEA